MTFLVNHRTTTCAGFTDLSIFAGVVFEVPEMSRSISTAFTQTGF